MRPIPNWKKCWRMFSVQAMTLAGSLQGTWLALPPDMQSRLPGWLVGGITIVLLVAGIIGRLFIQPKVES